MSHVTFLLAATWVQVAGAAWGVASLVLIIWLLFYLRRPEQKRRAVAEEINKMASGMEEERRAAQVLIQRERDARDRRRPQIDQLQMSSAVDPLTELQNYYALVTWLDSVTATIRKEEKIAILMMNIDDYHQIIDELGHSYGDELLIDVAHRLMQVMGEDDFLARTESDTFAMVSQNLADYSEYEEKVRKIQTVMNYPFQLAGREFVITLSMGICFAPQDGINTRVLLRNADLALQNAKRIGKNTYSYYTAELEELSTERMMQHAQLRTAISEHQLEVWFEPCVDPFDESLVGFGASVRWRHPDRGMVNFAEYRGLAEDTNLSVAIGDWLLRECCLQLRRWNDEGRDPVIAVPLFFKQLREESFIEKLDAVLEETGVQSGRLMFEIREDTFFENEERLRPVIPKIHERGIQLAMTYFGDRYGSLTMLRKVPVQFLRISNRIFAEETQANNVEFLKAVDAVTHALGIRIAVDRIEEPEDEAVLKDMGCHYARGLLYGESLPGDKVFFPEKNA